MDIILSDILDQGREAIITLWHIPTDGMVKEGEDLLEISTDKATFDIPSPCSGKLIKIFKTEGEKVKANERLAEIQEV